jgi:hypothetical protein
VACYNTLSEEGSDSMLCLRMSWAVESSVVKENTRIRASCRWCAGERSFDA